MTQQFYFLSETSFLFGCEDSDCKKCSYNFSPFDRLDKTCHAVQVRIQSTQTNHFLSYHGPSLESWLVIIFTLLNKVPLMRPNRLFTTSFIFSGDSVLSNRQAFDLQLAVSPEGRTGHYRQRLLRQPVLPLPAEVPRAAGLVDSHQPWHWKCEDLHQNIPGKLHQVTVLLVSLGQQLWRWW
jgi:hypothetical protein